MAASSKFAPGQTLEDRFLLLERVGQGGMSTVWKARDLANPGRLVAIKLPLPQFSSGTGSWSMFQREAEIGASLHHPSIVRFVALGPETKRSYVVMEYVAGTPLSSLIANGAQLSEPEALTIASQLCEAVAYLHAHEIVHYDLKPGNVLLCEGGSLRLIDFGTAHKLARGRSLLAGSMPAIASSEYVAPEQIRRVRGQASVDIYAIGATLYQMLTGHVPFEGDDPFVVASARQVGDPVAPRALVPSLSPETEEIVLRALRRDPAERYPSVAALKADLDHPERVQVTGLAGRLVQPTAWRKRLRLARFIAVFTVAPLASLVVLFRVLWWYLEQKR